MLFQEQLVVIRGAGDLATGVALRLHRAGFPIVMLELPAPLVVRRTVAFAEAVRAGAVSIEGVEGRRGTALDAARAAAARGSVMIVVDGEGHSLARLRPTVVVDARLAKRNLGTRRSDARFVVGLGPGFVVGTDVHAIVETMRGHELGRVLWQGSALPNTGTPGLVQDRGAERVLRAPIAGRVVGLAAIGQVVRQGQPIALLHSPDPALAEMRLVAPFTGRLRGLIADDVSVPAGLKIGDLDPRLDVDVSKVSDKALAIGGGVLEAVLSWLNERQAAGSR